jgi:hypothetical protein
MSDERDGADLRARFQSLRREDEGQGRPFSAFPPARPAHAPHQVAAGRRSVRGIRSGAAERPHLRPQLTLAVLACVVAAAAVTVHWLIPGAPRMADEAARARLSEWRAPTDWLLVAPSAQLLRGLPRVAESVVGGGMGIAGDEKTDASEATTKR